MKKINLKLLIIVLVGVAILLITFGFTYSLLSSTSIKQNQFYGANNKIEIEETFSAPRKLIPGSTIVKQPKIVNKGTVPVCVRVRVLFSDNAAKDFCDPIAINSGWTLNSDWYYYNNVLNVGASTNNVFEQIKIKTSVAQSVITDFQVIVYAESRSVVTGVPCSTPVSP